MFLALLSAGVLFSLQHISYKQLLEILPLESKMLWVLSQLRSVRIEIINAVIANDRERGFFLGELP